MTCDQRHYCKNEPLCANIPQRDDVALIFNIYFCLIWSETYDFSSRPAFVNQRRSINCFNECPCLPNLLIIRDIHVDSRGYDKF